jgi:hypothetical protein
VGPTDETYPPGTGGPIPNPKNIIHQTVVTTTVKDTNSGHTRIKTIPHVAGQDEDVDKAVHRAKGVPGTIVTVGRPAVVSDTDPLETQDGVAEQTEQGSGGENALEGEFAQLSETDKEEFIAHEEARTQASKATASPKPVLAKGPTTSRQLG